MNKPKKATKRPITIEFMEWTGVNHRPMHDFLEGKDKKMEVSGDNFYIDHAKGSGGLVIKTLEGENFATIGDMIIKGIKGEFYPCKPDIFHAVYFIE